MQRYGWAALALSALLAGCYRAELVDDDGLAADASADHAGDAGSDGAADAGIDPDARHPNVHPDAEPEPDADAGPPCDRVFYADVDGDGFGDPDTSTVGCYAPAGHVDNGDDCYDENADAYPGQTESFAMHRGDGSFDFDCDGVEEPLWVERGTCPKLDPSCPPPAKWPSGFSCDYEGLSERGTTGWWGGCLDPLVMHGVEQCSEYPEMEIPRCGESALWKLNAATCAGQTTTMVQRCR